MWDRCRRPDGSVPVPFSLTIGHGGAGPHVRLVAVPPMADSQPGPQGLYPTRPPMLRIALSALCVLAAPVAAQTVYEVRQESAAGVGDFDSQPLLGTVSPYDGSTLSAEAYYDRAPSQPYTYQGPRPLYSEMATSSVNLFFVETTDGLTLMTVLGQISANNTLWQATTSGPFDALLVVDDPNNADDAFTFTAATGTLVANGKIGTNFGDGHVLGLEDNATGAIYFELDSGTNGLSAANRGPLRVYGDDGAGGDTIVPASLDDNRRIRLLPLSTEIVSPEAPQDVPGWRLLSAPVSGLTALDLADINLVFGVPAGVTNPGQFEFAGRFNPRGQRYGNLYHEFDGTETTTGSQGQDSTAIIYVPVPDTDYEFELGRGIWWYWYDQDLDLDPGDAGTWGGGRGVGYDLSNPAFSLAASGAFATDDVSVDFPLATVAAHIPALDRRYFYMGGNPFTVPFNVDGISATNGVVQGLVYTWDPADNGGAGGHVAMARSGLLNGTGADAAVWQGLLIEVVPIGTDGPTITYDYAMTDGAATPPFYGKTAAAPEARSGLASGGRTPEVVFTLTGTTDAGVAVEDKAWLRSLPDAEGGFERHDGSKFTAPAARIAFPIRRDGGLYRLAMNALPDGTAAPLTRRVNVRMDFAADAPGTYTLTWDDALAAGWKAGFRDRVTGETVRMWKQDSYTFTASPTDDWTRRFDLVVAPDQSVASVAPEAGLSVAEARVGEAYPNPASGGARVEVVLPAEQAVRVAVYDALGREVAVAHDGPLAAGANAVALPAATLAGGTYVVRVTGVGLAETRRLTVAR